MQAPPQCSIYSHRFILIKHTMINTRLVMITSHKECKELRRASTTVNEHASIETALQEGDTELVPGVCREVPSVLWSGKGD